MSDTKQKQTKEANMTVKLTAEQHHEILSAWLGATRIQGDFTVLGTTQGKGKTPTLTIEMVVE